MGVPLLTGIACQAPQPAAPPSDRPAFVKLSQALQDAGILALKAIDAKDTEALIDAGGHIDEACENLAALPKPSR